MRWPAAAPQNELRIRQPTNSPVRDLTTSTITVRAATDTSGTDRMTCPKSGPGRGAVPMARPRGPYAQPEPEPGTVASD